MPLDRSPACSWGLLLGAAPGRASGPKLAQHPWVSAHTVAPLPTAAPGRHQPFQMGLLSISSHSLERVFPVEERILSLVLCLLTSLVFSSAAAPMPSSLKTCLAQHHALSAA